MAIGNIFRRFFRPETKKSQDGRDQWPTRASFILASMGGCVGLGNILRYPSQIFNNFGLQWFIPYFIAFFLLGIPGLILEISIGQTYRSGPVIAYHHMNKRLKGAGFGLVYNGYMIVLYYVVILAWAMAYFRNSFKSPLPWEGDSETFYMQRVIRNGDPVPGQASGGSVQSYTSYPQTGLIGETVGWCAFTWFLVWLCIWRGVGVTGRVVYFTMGLPIIMIIILLGRGVSLPNAEKGLRYIWATWRSDTLANGKIWQDACGQIFFSIGLGMGYFTTYASYNNKFQNSVQDALIICSANSLIEILASIAVFGIIGYLDINPADSESDIGSFDIAFLTFPEGTAQMPGAQFWSAIFFLTLMVLGVSSSFALTDSLITMISDSDFGRRLNRSLIVTVVIVISFLISLIFCTEFGYYLLDAFDTWFNNFSLLWVVMCEFLGATMIYRYQDVVGLLGWVAYGTYTTTYLLSLVLGVAVAHSVQPAAGAGVGFGIFVVGLTAALFLAKTPRRIGHMPPHFWSRNVLLEKFYYLTLYQGCQLSLDLNLIVAAGNNWRIPIFWGPLLRYISVPILAIILSFAYPSFHATRMDPLHILGFTLAHFSMAYVAIGFVMPRFFNPFIPFEKRGEGQSGFAPNVPIAGVAVGSEYPADGAFEDPVSFEAK